MDDFKYFRSDYSGHVSSPHLNAVCIPLTGGKHAIIDREDYETISAMKWRIGARPDDAYAYSSNENNIRMHRMIMGAQKGQIIDHINNDVLDNRKANLRFCGTYDNAVNRSPNKGKLYKGVLFHKPTGKYYARMRVDGKLKHLSTHDTAEAAARAYDAHAKHIHGEFACLNFKTKEQSHD